MTEFSINLEFAQRAFNGTSFNPERRGGFKWAPSQKAWQRQITINGKLAIKRFAEFMETIDDE